MERKKKTGFDRRERRNDLPVQTWIYQGSLSADLNGKEKKTGFDRRER